MYGGVLGVGAIEGGLCSLCGGLRPCDMWMYVYLAIYMMISHTYHLYISGAASLTHVFTHAHIISYSHTKQTQSFALPAEFILCNFYLSEKSHIAKYMCVSLGISPCAGTTHFHT